MPEVFKAEVTQKKGADKVEVKEGALFNVPKNAPDSKILEYLSSRASDKDYIDSAVRNLRKRLADLNAKLKKAQGVLGTSVSGLSDKEIRVAADIVTRDLDKRAKAAMAKIRKLGFGAGKKFDLEVYDMNKSDIIGEISTFLSGYINSTLDNILKVVDDKDADKSEIAKVLEPKIAKPRGKLARHVAKARGYKGKLDDAYYAR